MQFTSVNLNKEQTIISQDITNLKHREEKVQRREGRGKGLIIPRIFKSL